MVTPEFFLFLGHHTIWQEVGQVNYHENPRIVLERKQNFMDNHVCTLVAGRVRGDEFRDGCRQWYVHGYMVESDCQ